MLFLVEKGADINAKDIRDSTPLHFAARYNENSEVLAVLIENGADINAEDEYGRTPLKVAKKAKANSEVIAFLVKNGAHEIKPDFEQDLGR